MSIGTQYECKKPYNSFQPGPPYYFAGNRPADRVALVQFVRNACKVWKPLIFELARGEFLRLCGDGIFAKAEVQRQLPEWLAEVEGVNFQEIEDRRYRSKKIGYWTSVNLRLAYIERAADNFQEIIAAQSMTAAINRIRRLDAPQCNRARFLIWFWAYVLHGRNPWALKAPTHNCGRWDRGSDTHRNKKYGRQSLALTPFNSSSVVIADKCVAAFMSKSRKYKSWKKIHSAALKEDFKVEALQLADGSTRKINKNSEPFPSFNQFRYRVIKALGEEKVAERLYGAKHARQTAKHYRGSFTSATRNVLEELQVDCYSSPADPLRLDGLGAANQLHICRGVCTTASAVVGVGFSLGAESRDAYYSMLFSCVASRDLLERIYGLSPGILRNWTARGYSPHYRSDRGAGASIGGGNYSEPLFSIEALTPSGEGQSKAFIESSHPRSEKIIGHERPPIGILTTPEMIKRELLRAMHDNEVSDVTSRLSPEAAEYFSSNGLAANPNNLFSYLVDNCCSSAVQMDDHAAVRKWARKIDLEITEQGLRWNQRTYTSVALLATKYFQRARRDGSIVTGYIVTPTIRVAWAEIDGRLIEIAARPLRRAQSAEQDATIDDATSHAENIRKISSTTRVHKVSAELEIQRLFERETGKPWYDADKGTRPRQKRSGSAERQLLMGPKKK